MPYDIPILSPLPFLADNTKNSPKYWTNKRLYYILPALPEFACGFAAEGLSYS
jgi:hypothetical protein